MSLPSSCHPTSIVTGRDQAIEIKSKPVFNYMQQTSIGTFCPFTKQYLGTGVESALHASMPIRADIGLKNGQLSINLRTPQDQESQKNKPVLQLKVTPYTIRTHITKHIHEQKQQIKTIYSKGEQYRTEYQLGKRLGVDLKLKVDTDRKNPHLGKRLGVDLKLKVDTD